jgi:hypothetical protein
MMREIPDRQAQRVWLMLVIVGVILSFVGWFRFAS